MSHPHYFAELLIYASLLLVSHFDPTFLLITAYVLATHLLMAEQSHRWYLDTFGKLYPTRRILIPWVY